MHSQILRRQDLYKEFIEQASKCYVHALQQHEPDIAGLVELYARLNRMRVLSSSKVLDCAEQVVRKILDTYLAPNKSFLELREMLNSGAVDPLHDFSAACRAEVDWIRAKQILSRPPHASMRAGQSQTLRARYCLRPLFHAEGLMKIWFT